MQAGAEGSAAAAEESRGGAQASRRGNSSKGAKGRGRICRTATRADGDGDWRTGGENTQDSRPSQGRSQGSDWQRRGDRRSQEEWQWDDWSASCCAGEGRSWRAAGRACAGKACLGEGARAAGSAAGSAIGEGPDGRRAEHSPQEDGAPAENGEGPQSRKGRKGSKGRGKSAGAASSGDAAASTAAALEGKGAARRRDRKGGGGGGRDGGGDGEEGARDAAAAEGRGGARRRDRKGGGRGKLAAASENAEDAAEAPEEARSRQAEGRPNAGRAKIGPRTGRQKTRKDDGSGEGGGSPMGGTMTVTERLTEQLGKGSYDCMICLSRVTRQQPIWQCDKCWCVIHLKCIQQWIKKLSDSGGVERAWTCPNCRYHRVGALPRYRCFCEKLVDPEPSPHWTAHSCGEVCGRDRGCPHPCPELCHPGPCPPCTAVGSSGQCHCGHEERERMRCGEPDRWSCGEPCGKLLSCGVHRCTLRCHPGPCPPCKVPVMQECFCGVTEQERLCREGAFSCGGVCGMPLNCGEHSCERICHPGDCGACPRDPAVVGDRCACGNMRNCSGEAAAALLVRWVGNRASCADPLPLCGKICGKMRDCGHPCKRTCHEGPCDPCDEIVERGCRCGQSKKGVVCGELGEWMCDRVCKVKKSCGKHRCEVVCCPGHGLRYHENHMCLQVCGKPLSCGIHNCEEFCHLGKCPPCRVYRHEPLFCACGATSISPPVPCGTQPPYCDEVCGVELECGHICPAKCHFGECPPCRELVTRLCKGGHREMPNQPCHVGPISCGRLCGRELPCGHVCNSQCHAGDCPPCTQPCNAPRVYCEHTCDMECHDGTQCKDTPCKHTVKLACECGLRITEQVCGAYSGNRRPQLLPPRCDQTCQRSLGNSTSSRNGSWNAGRPKAADEPTRYVPDLHNLACQHPKYVQMLEDKFFALIAAPTGTPAAAPVVLPPCDSTRRLLAAEYARLHWKLRTSTRKDSAQGWWQLRIEQTKGMRAPQPKLSELTSGGSAQATRAGHLLPTLELRPRLCFSGLSGAGDEVYDFVGPEGLLAVRPGQRTGEILAFFEKETFAVQVFRRLTGQAPGADALPVTSGGSGGSGARVLLAQTLSGKGSSASVAAKLAGAGQRPPGAGASTSRRDGWSSQAEGDIDKEEVLDSWEDALG